MVDEKEGRGIKKRRNRESTKLRMDVSSNGTK